MVKFNMIPVEILDNSKYSKELKLALREIFPTINGRLAYKNKNIYLTNKTLTSLRHIQNGEDLKNILKKMFLESAYKSEISGANSADLMILGATSLLNEKSINIENVQIELEQFRQWLMNCSKNVNKDSLNQIIKNSMNDDKLSEMVLQSIFLAGIEGKIIPKHNLKGEYYIELKEGCTFQASSYPIFYISDKWKFENVRVLIVDGVIETEASIDILLGETLQSKESLLIVARGYEEEVIATLANNKQLKVLPVRVPFELESINLIADMGVVCGSDVITPMKGDLISSARLKNLPIINEISAIASTQTITITNPKTSKQTNIHIRDLEKRREKAQNEEASELLNKRIKSLSSQTVYLNVGSKTEHEKLIELEEIDYGLRIAKSSLSNGILDVNEISDQFSNLKPIFDSWKQTSNSLRPIKSIYCATHHAISLVNLLNSIDCAVLLDRSSFGDKSNNSL